MKEEWRKVEGHEEYYISNKGRFRKGKELRSTNVDNEGYCRCYIDGKTFKVHRLVAQAFIPNPDNLPVVDHINCNKSDNRVENLRWITVSGNTQAAYDNGLISMARKIRILAVDEEDNATLYESQAHASRETGIPRKMITKVIQGNMKQCGGYRFLRINKWEDKTK